MSNSLYNASGIPTDMSHGIAALVRNEFAAIGTAFNKTAPLSSPALTDTPTAPTASTGASGPQIATLDFVNNTVMSAMTNPPGMIWTTFPSNLPGSLLQYTGGATPSNALPCDRSNYLASAYPNLFAVAQGNPAFGMIQRAATSAQIYTFAYGNNVYVAGGVNGVLYSSADGKTWVSRTSPFSSNILKIIFANGYFVAVGSTAGGGWNTVIATSVDGTNWTSRMTSASLQFSNVAYGNGILVATQFTSTVYTSVDNGVTWNTYSSNLSNAPTGIIYAGGLFIACSSCSAANGISTSADGISWTARLTTSFSGNPNIAYGNGLFVCGSGSSTSDTYYSSNGTSWTAATKVPSGVGTDLVYGNGVFVMSASGSGMKWSSDGANWYSASTSGGGTKVAFSGAFFVAASGSPYGFIYSKDGKSWVRSYYMTDNLDATTFAQFSYIAGCNGQIFSGGSGGNNVVASTTLPSDTTFNVPQAITAPTTYVRV